MQRRIFAVLGAAVSALAFGSVGAQLLAEPIQTSDNATAQSRGWLTFENVRVDVRGGVRLVQADGSPLRASQISVWADDIRWQASYVDGMSTSPANNNDGFAGIYVFQKGGGSCWLAASNTHPPGSNCSLSNQEDIYVMVNDGTIGNTNDGHGDNGGSFDLHVKVIAL